MVATGRDMSTNKKLFPSTNNGCSSVKADAQLAAYGAMNVWGYEVDRTVSHCLLDSSVIAIRLCPKSENSLQLIDNDTDTRLNQTA